MLSLNYVKLDCATENISSAVLNVLLSGNATVGPAPLGTIAAGGTRCFRTTVEYPGDTPSDEVQRAQSDRATWRFRWVAQA